ncbi:TIGR04086 family membrane protein [Filobacillus milosensis]|uniref:TIGR04086 family membrane protein n=1 Tax=Filobacillus milosensis TaxID=94137 RepID=A0A4Y8ISZ3_9BACI|nr:TIGR04086 family membrane protein [Filobacillus milosensis]TFB24912.1 TIGR04086 family membrane protein [Filobacillus milosensis]
MSERMRASLYGVLSIIALMLISSLMIALIVNFSDMSSSAFKWTSFITSVLVLMIGGFIGGGKTEEKGWMTGLIVGVLYVVGIILYQFLAQDAWMYENQLLYFLIFVVAAIVGSMMGVNTRK